MRIRFFFWLLPILSCLSVLTFATILAVFWEEVEVALIYRKSIKPETFCETSQKG